MFLIDTSIWIAALRRGGPPDVARRVRQWIVDNQAATMPIIRIELSAGCRSAEEFRQLNDRLSGLVNLSLSEAHYTAAAEAAFRLRKKGITAGVADLLIGVCAASCNGCTLVHADFHFDEMEETLSLKHINWSNRLLK